VITCHVAMVNISSVDLFAGKILFGRSQVHQVAEKRRGKIEEFCQVPKACASCIGRLPFCQGFIGIKARNLVSSCSFIHQYYI